MLGSWFDEGTGDCGTTNRNGGGGHPALLPVSDTIVASFCKVMWFLYTGVVEFKEVSVLDVICPSHYYRATALQT